MSSPSSSRIRVAVLGAIHAVDARAREFRLGGGGAIQIILERNGEGRVIRSGGPRHARRWHHAGAEYPDDLLPGLGLGSDIRRIELIEGETGGLEALVMASDAILIQRFRQTRLEGAQARFEH